MQRAVARLPSPFVRGYGRAMSSPLSSARVLSVEGCTALIRIEPQQALTLPYGDGFALMIAHEPLVTIVYERPGQPWRRPIGGELAAAVRAELGGSDRAVSDALTGGADRAVVAAAARRYVRHGGYRDPVGALVPTVAPEASGWFVEPAVPRPPAAGRAVIAAFDAYWEAKIGPAPAITIGVHATAPRWLAHLVPGMLWDSYVFDDDAPMFP